MCDTIKNCYDLLQLQMIGRNPIAHETVRHRQFIKHRNQDIWSFPQHCFGCVKTAGTCPNDGDAECRLLVNISN